MQYALQATVLGPLISNPAIPRFLAGNYVLFANSTVTVVVVFMLVKYNSLQKTCLLAPLSTIISCWNTRLFFDSIPLTAANEHFPFLAINILQLLNPSFLLLDFYQVAFSSDCLRLCAALPLSGRLQLLTKCPGLSHRKQIIGDLPRGRFILLLSLFGHTVTAAAWRLLSEIANVFVVSATSFNLMHSSIKILVMQDHVAMLSGRVLVDTVIGTFLSWPINEDSNIEIFITSFNSEPPLSAWEIPTPTGRRNGSFPIPPYIYSYRD